jgi:hypothetical protein
MEQQEELQSNGLTGDRSSKVDFLGFKPYVEAVAAFLTDSNTVPPLTVSIEGDWGSGKSSFIDQLDEELRTKLTTYHFVRFNPWRYSEHEALWAAFAVEFERCLAENIDTWRLCKFRASRVQWKKLLWDLGAIVLPCMTMLVLALFGLFFFDTGAWKPVLQSIALILGVFLPLGPAIKIISEAKDKISKGLMKFDVKKYLKERPDYSGKIPFLDEFHKDLEAITTALIGSEPIYIFIDDLDRCTPEQAIELMQALNLLISEKIKAIFILAIDRKKVAAGYAAKHASTIKYLEPALHLNMEQGRENSESLQALRYGYEFLEKFIQVPFQLPNPTDTDLNRLLAHIIEFAQEPAALSLQEATSDVTMGSSNGIKFENEKKEEISEVVMLNQREIATEVMRMIAPSFKNNPRAIKKFFNTFRLQLYVGSKTGLFRKQLASGLYKEGITLFQLAKFLVIKQRWPEFIEDWLWYLNLPKHLLKVPNYPPPIPSDALRESHREQIKNEFLNTNLLPADTYTGEWCWNLLLHWHNEGTLIELLEFGEPKDGYSLNNFPLNKVLSVSPAYKTQKFSTEKPSFETIDEERKFRTDHPDLEHWEAHKRSEIKGMMEEGLIGSESGPDAKQEEGWPDLDEILAEVQEYLDQHKQEGQEEYILDGVVAETAYFLRKEGRTLPEIKAAIDEFRQNYQNSQSAPDFDENKPFAYDTEGQGYDEGHWISPDQFPVSKTGIKDPISGNLRHRNAQGAIQGYRQEKAILSQILAEIQSEHPEASNIPFDDQIEEIAITLLEQGETPQRIKRQILDYLFDRNLDSPTNYEVSGSSYSGENYSAGQDSTFSSIEQKNILEQYPDIRIEKVPNNPYVRKLRNIRTGGSVVLSWHHQAPDDLRQHIQSLNVKKAESKTERHAPKDEVYKSAEWGRTVAEVNHFIEGARLKGKLLDMDTQTLHNTAYKMLQDSYTTEDILGALEAIVEEYWLKNR